MILITKDEKETILEKYPATHVVRTMRADSKRHRYYMVEDPGPMRMLRQMRGEVVEKRKRRR